MYNPFIEAAKALTCADARRFYVQTALEHSFLTAAVVVVAANRAVEAGQQFREIHDRHIVPLTLNSLIGFAQFLGVIKSQPENAEFVQPLLLAPAVAGLLPPGPEPEVVEVDLSEVVDSGFSLEALFQLADEGIATSDLEPVEPEGDLAPQFAGEWIATGEYDHEPVEPEGDSVPSLFALTVRELRQMAKGRVKSPSKLTKAELIEALQSV